jgi:hypothetical protein
MKEISAHYENKNYPAQFFRSHGIILKMQVRFTHEKYIKHDLPDRVNRDVISTGHYRDSTP